jgi:hypothetical protein
MIRKLWNANWFSKAALLGGGLAVLVVLAIALTAFGNPAGPQGTPEQLAARRAAGEQGFSLAVPSAQRVAGFVETYAPRVEETERDIEKLNQALKAADERQKKQEELLRTLAGELKDARTEIAQRQDAPRGNLFPAPVSGTSKPQDEVREEAPRIQRIRLAVPPAPGTPQVQLPAGSFAEGVMLTGVFAPVQGQALPVQIRLSGEWTTPNRGRVPIGDAFLVGKAQGDANSERATVQVEKLSYVHTSGRSIEIPVNGFIVDKDGIQGAQGKYVWRAEEFLLYAAGAGAIAGAGDALSQSQTATQLNPVGGATQIITGDIGKYAGGRALSGASNQLTQAIGQRLGEITPAIWVPNGRKVTVTLIDGAALTGVAPKELKNADARTPYSGLDLDR